jgi:putative DNA primase/helicase
MADSYLGYVAHVRAIPQNTRPTRPMKKEPISLHERIERYIAACPPAISGQNGHDQTFNVACALVQGFDLSPEDAFSFLASYNQRCDPPWTERELGHKLRDADRAEGYKPRGYLL